MALGKLDGVTVTDLGKVSGLSTVNIIKVAETSLPWDDLAAAGMTRSISIASEAYMAVNDEYAPIIDDLVNDGYISGVILEDTGKFNYYVSGNRRFCAWWEGDIRSVSGITGKYSLDSNGGNPVFRSLLQLDDWVSNFPV